MNEHKPMTWGQSWDRMRDALEKLHLERADILLTIEAAKKKGELSLMGKTMSDLVAVSDAITKVSAELKQLQEQMEAAAQRVSTLADAKLEAARVPVVACHAPISNYYGTPFVFETAEGHFFGIRAEDCDGECVKVSKAFFEAFTRDLGGDFCDIGAEQEVRECLNGRVLTLSLQSPGIVEDYDPSYDDEGADQ